MSLEELLSDLRERYAQEQARRKTKRRRKNPASSIREDAYYREIADLLRTMPSDWRRQYRSGKDKLSAIGGPVLPAGTSAASAPTPEQAMLLIGITAGGNPSKDTPFGPHKVPKAVREAAMKGIRLSHANNYGAWDFIGLARAIELVIVPSVSDTSFKRMGKYLFRHKKDARASGFGDDENPSRGYMAWLNWGGDPAVTWTGAFEKNPADGGQPAEALSPESLTVPKGVGEGRRKLPAKAIAVDLSDPSYSGKQISVVLLDPSVKRRKEVTSQDVLGMANAIYDDIARAFQISVAAAEPGYGYLLYALVAERCRSTRTGTAPLIGSNDQTAYAKRFWDRQPGKKLFALTPEEFKAQFGTTADALFGAGEALVLSGMRGRAEEATDRLGSVDEYIRVWRANLRDEVKRAIGRAGGAYFGDYYEVSKAAAALGPQRLRRPLSPREGVDRLTKAAGKKLRWADLALVETAPASPTSFKGYLVRVPKGKTTFGPENVLASVSTHGARTNTYTETESFRLAPEREDILALLQYLAAPPARGLPKNLQMALTRGDALHAVLVQQGFETPRVQDDLFYYFVEAANEYGRRKEKRSVLFPLRNPLANPRFPDRILLTMPV
jgi:hypothetical protein